MLNSHYMDALDYRYQGAFGRVEQSAVPVLSATETRDVPLCAQLHYVLVMVCTVTALDRCGCNEGCERWRQCVVDWELGLSRFGGLFLQMLSFQLDGDVSETWSFL